MTGSAQYESQRVIVCCICAGPIPLETTKTMSAEKPFMRSATFVRRFRVQNGHRSPLPRELAKFDSRAVPPKIPRNR